MLSRPPEKRAKVFIKRAPFMMLDKWQLVYQCRGMSQAVS
jgi:hypothetical protein